MSSAQLVKTTKRSSAVVLKSKTTGYLQDSEMVDVVRRDHEGSFSVQVVPEPVLPSGLKGHHAGWNDQFILNATLLDVQYVKSKDACAQNANAKYAICKEQVTGFMKFGYYQRVFAHESDGVIKISDDVDKTGDNVRFVNLWTRELDSTCNPASIKVWAGQKKVWTYTKREVQNRGIPSTFWQQRPIRCIVKNGMEG
jgi:hypothetical protein